MKQKFLYIICLVFAWTTICHGQTPGTATNLAPLGNRVFPFVEKHDLDAGGAQGYVTLTVENPTITNGNRVSIDVRLVNTGLSRDFYNPYFTAHISPPAQIAVYDANHNYLSDLCAWVSGSFRGNSWDDWTHIPGGGSYIGFTMSVKPAYGHRLLPPGDYYLQFIYYKAFIALDPPWADSDPDVAAKQKLLKYFNDHFDCGELFRSNPIKITILK